MNALREFRDTSFIKIVTGIRRCGKSTLLKLFSGELRQSGVDEAHILEINFESMRYRDILHYLSLYDYVKAKMPELGKTYLFFDEIQMVRDWQRAIDSFCVDFDVDIYVTGSNAYFLSSEFATLLSGRCVEIRMLPLSFHEFLDFYAFGPSIGLEEKFQTYLKFGGMPAIHEIGFNEPRVNDMLEGVYSTVILKDVMERNKLTDQTLLRKIVTFLADNLGNVTSPNSISKVLANEGRAGVREQRKAPASRTVDNYIEMLQNAFIFYGASRYDIKGKQLLKTLNKYYIVDIGIRNMLLGYRNMDRGHILENVVYLELLRRGYRVFIGKAGEKEIDFVAERPSDRKYIQVAETLAGEETRSRELEPLRSVADNYEKIVLSMDRSFIQSYDGIKAVNIIDYLLSDN
ncbi:MAG: ATP-binding protein [Synergistaceae bacterium]|jgi:predicted AAA+ superfamily ATPase|nr:ATP-binding protein [Synergistaceae bacterium]